MSKLDICISSMKYTTNVDDSQLDKLVELSKQLNTKTNELIMDIGKISDRLVLFTLLLINMNKEMHIFSNFENGLIELLKKIAPYMRNGDDVESQLIMGNILLENKMQDLPDRNVIEENTNYTNTNNVINTMVEIINVVKKMTSNINNL